MIGVAAALLLARLMTSFYALLYGVRPMDPATFALIRHCCRRRHGLEYNRTIGHPVRGAVTCCETVMAQTPANTASTSPIDALRALRDKCRADVIVMFR